MLKRYNIPELRTWLHEASSKAEQDWPRVMKMNKTTITMVVTRLLRKRQREASRRLGKLRQYTAGSGLATLQRQRRSKRLSPKQRRQLMMDETVQHLHESAAAPSSTVAAAAAVGGVGGIDYRNLLGTRRGSATVKSRRQTARRRTQI